LILAEFDLYLLDGLENLVNVVFVVVDPLEVISVANPEQNRAGIHKNENVQKELAPSRLFLNSIHKHSFRRFGAGTRPFLRVDLPVSNDHL
jgi:hypothetical protein